MKIERIPDGWEILPFDDCVDKKESKGKYQKLQTKDYLDEGQYPIVDQGQEFIAGYTNDENTVYTGSLPVTVFGDHTLYVKFVNMQFAVGADGTVPLYPNKNKLTDKFFYYLISNHRIKSEGYQRHVKYLKQKRFVVPPLPEQRKIAEILSAVDEIIEKTNAIIQETQQLKKGMMQKLFAEGIGHTEFKETKIGRIRYGTIPIGWNEAELSSICNVTSSKRIMMHEYVDSGIPFYRSKEIIEKMRNIGHDRILYISESRFQEIKRRFGSPQEGDILMTAVGSLGIPYLMEEDEDFYFKDGNLIWLRDISSDINKKFLIYYFTSFGFTRVIDVITGGSSQKALTIEKLEKVKIPLPTSSEQQKITQILTEVDTKIETEQAYKTGLEQLKKGLMQVLLTGKVRVKV